MLFTIIHTQFTSFDDIQQTKFLIYLKNWLNRLILKDERKKVKDIEQKVISIMLLLTSGKIANKNKIYFEDNILLNMFTLFSLNEQLNNSHENISKIAAYKLEAFFIKIINDIKTQFETFLEYYLVIDYLRIIEAVAFIYLEMKMKKEEAYIFQEVIYFVINNFENFKFGELPDERKQNRYLYINLE
jgi:hypothetical protein